MATINSSNNCWVTVTVSVLGALAGPGPVPSGDRMAQARGSAGFLEFNLFKFSHWQSCL